MKTRKKLPIYESLKNIFLTRLPKWAVVITAIVIWAGSIILLSANNRPSHKLGVEDVRRDIARIELDLYTLLESQEGGSHPLYDRIQNRQAELDITQTELQKRLSAVMERSRDYGTYSAIYDSGDKRTYRALSRKFDNVYQDTKNLDQQRRDIARQRIEFVSGPSIDKLKNVRHLLLEKEARLLSQDKPWYARGGRVIEILLICLLAYSYLLIPMRFIL